MTNHDLITQVGGIERAREILEGAVDGATHHIPSSGSNICCHNENHFYLSQLVAFGVEHIKLSDLRAAIANHTEFEVGDLVVSACDGVIPILFKTIEVQHASFDEYVGCQSMSGLITYYLAINEIRHATPSEIKAGHRIELSGNTGQLEVLDMIHISPSCVVIER